jgi:hypothetical protein
LLSLCDLVVHMPFRLRLSLFQFSLLFLGKTEFDPDEDAHVVGDCVKVIVVTTFCPSRTINLIPKFNIQPKPICSAACS